MSDRYTCPECKGPLEEGFACPGYPSPRGVMVCAYPCGNANQFDCQNEDCGWWYRFPNGYRSDIVSMGVAPGWLEDWKRENFILFWSLEDD